MLTDNQIPLPEMCVYGQSDKATGNCYNCSVSLCSACGFTVKGFLYCNECYEDIFGMCSSCGSALEPQHENNGFDGYSGPRHDEVVGYYPCECREEEDL